MRADFRCLSSAEGERYVWEQQLDGTPSPATCASSEVEIALRPRGGRRRSTLTLRADAARHVAPRLADDARAARGEILNEALDGIERAAAVSRMRPQPRRDRRWWGWGDPASRRAWTSDAGRRCASGSATLEPVATRRRARGRSTLPAARAAARCAGRRGRRGCRLQLASRTGSATRPAAATRTWCGCAAAASTRRPTRSCSPADADAVRRVLEVCASEGVAVVPFGGGTSVVGGVEPLRGAHSRLISLDLARLREVARRPPLADGQPRRRPARARRRKRRLRRRVSSSATIRSRSSTRRSAASPPPAPPGRPRAATGASTPWSARLRLIAPAGELRTLRDAPHRRRARRCASSSSAPRGCSA